MNGLINRAVLFIPPSHRAAGTARSGHKRRPLVQPVIQRVGVAARSTSPDATLKGSGTRSVRFSLFPPLPDCYLLPTRVQFKSLSCLGKKINYIISGGVISLGWPQGEIITHIEWQ